MIHIAGTHVQIGPLLRQRCAWCGYIMIDYDLTMVAVPIGQEGSPATWPIGGLVMVDGSLSYEVLHADGDTLPDGCCGKTDLAMSLK